MSDEQIRPYPPARESVSAAAPHLGDYWYVLSRRLWLIALVFVVTTASAVWVVLGRDGRYQASLTLQVNDPFERSRPLTASGPGLGSEILVDPIQSEIELLRSSRIAEGVVHELGLRLTTPEESLTRSMLFRRAWVGEDTPPGRFYLVYLPGRSVEIVRSDGVTVARGAEGDVLDAGGFRLIAESRPEERNEYALEITPIEPAIAEVRIGLEAVPRTNTNLIDIYYTSADQDLAPAILNAAAEVLRSNGAARVRSAADQDVHFIQEQLDSARSQLGSSLTAIREFKETEAFTDLSLREQELVTQSRQYADEVERLEHHLDILRALSRAMAQGGSEGVDLVRLLAELPPDVNPEIRTGAQRIQEKTDALNSLLTTDQKTREHPEARALSEQIRDLEGDLIASVRASIAVSEQDLATVATRLSNVRARQQDFPGLENQLQTLEIQQSLDQSTYQFLLSQLYQARITASAAGAYLVIVDPAVEGVRLSGLGRSTLLLAGLLGLGLGVAVGVFAEYLDRTIRTSSEAERLLGLAVLGVIPTLRRGGSRSRTRSHEGDEAPRLAARDPFDSASEAFRRLRLNLTFTRPGDEEVRSLLITSPGPAEGKSTTSLNLAETFAQHGERVVLIDADLRRPTLHKALDISCEPGLSDMLIQDLAPAEVTVDDVYPNLDIIPAGALAPNPSELVSSEAMAEVLELLRQTYDRVIVDSPPILAATDAAGLANAVDGVLIVLRSGKTEQKAAERGTEQLRRLGIPMIGVALNDVPATAHEESYYLQYQARYFTDARRPESDGGRLRRRLSRMTFP